MKTKLLFMMVLIAQGLAAQNQYLDINQVKAYTTANATNFFVNGSAGEGYEVPKGSGKKCDFANSLWIGGKDVAGNIKVMSQTYRSGGARIDSWGGPLLSAGPLKGTCPLNGVSGFINTTFKVNKTTIDSFKLAWQNGLVQNGSYTIPSTISNWPGTFAPNPKEVLAPYFDNNNDTIYNPLDGDYPSIKGDQAIFVVYNDMGNVKTSSLTSSIGLEVRRLSYAYNCPNLSGINSVLNFTTFHEYTIINKSNALLDSVFCGMWSDADLGGANDDYIGCDVTREVGYIYNSDNFDANQSSLLGYLNNPPIFAYKLFRTAASDGVDNDNDLLIDESDESSIKEIDGFTYFNNTGQGAAPQFTDPVNGNDFYNYLRNRFRDGSPLIYSRNGFPTVAGPNTSTKFCYPRNSDPLNLGTGGIAPINNIAGGWSESNNGTGIPNAPDDRRFVLNTRQKKLLPNQTIKLNLALIFTPNPAAAAFANLLPTAQQDWDAIDSMYVNNAFPSACSSISTLTKNGIQVNILSGFPNPAKNEFIITGFSGTEKNISITISDVNGKVIQALKQAVVNESIRIDLQNYESGIYFIKVNGEQILKVIKAE